MKDTRLDMPVCMCSLSFLPGINFLPSFPTLPLSTHSTRGLTSPPSPPADAFCARAFRFPSRNDQHHRSPPPQGYRENEMLCPRVALADVHNTPEDPCGLLSIFVVIANPRKSYVSFVQSVRRFGAEEPFPFS